MDSASSLAYPGGRILVGWWRQLHAHRPVAMWIGYLFVHRVEALVECIEPRPIDGVTLHLLQAIAVDHPQGMPHVHAANPLPARLHLPPPALHQLLIALERQQLVQRCEPGCWCLTPRGRDVVQAGADRTPLQERRTLAFLERLTPAGRRQAPPHFVPIGECPAVSWEVNEAHRFDLSVLTEAIAQPPPWHQRYGFPAGVHRVLGRDQSAPDEDWQRVIVDRPERSVVALVAAADRSLLGFAAEADGWKLHADAPVLRIGEPARDALGDLSAPPSLWQEAWRLWCRQRHLPLAEADACRIQFDGIYLDVQAPESFVQRLRLAKSDILRDESSLLAGDGYLRAAALLRLQPAA
jgi:hypothetical protein